MSLFSKKTTPAIDPEQKELIEKEIVSPFCIVFGWLGFDDNYESCPWTREKFYPF